MIGTRWLTWKRLAALCALGVSLAAGGPARAVTLLTDTSNEGPAFATLNARLYMAWVGLDGRINVMASDDGKTFFNKVTLGEHTYCKPALASSGARLVLAWTGTDTRLNVLSSSDGVTWGGKATLDERATNGPALAAGPSSLVLAWSGTDAAHSLNVLQSTDGSSWGGKVVLPFSSSGLAPALAGGGGRVWMAYAAGGNAVSLAQSADGRTWSSRGAVGEALTRAGPGLAWANGEVVLAWIAPDGRNSLRTARSGDGVTFHDRASYQLQGDGAPSVVPFRGVTYVGFNWVVTSGERLDWSHLLGLLPVDEPAQAPAPAPDWQALPDVLAIQLQGADGRLVSCASRILCAEEASTGFLADGRPDPRVTFTLEPIDGSLSTGSRVALRTQEGKYVTAEGGGGDGVTATRKVRDVWETFTLEVVGGGAARAGGTLALRAYNGQYVTNLGDGAQLKADRQALGPWECFTVRTLATHAALRGAPSGRTVDVQALAEQYAPVVYHTNDETNFPTNVDWFLPRTQLRGYDDCASPDWHSTFAYAPSQAQLTWYSFTGGCGWLPNPANDGVVSSAGTRSDSKQRTFYLSDVAEPYRWGSLDSRDWTTYTHAYPNLQGGLTIQYWRFYAYNDALNNHGGDWEGIQVVLGADLRPDQLRYMGHTGIDTWTPAELEWEGDHPRVYSEGGGHASRTRGSDVNANGANGHVEPGIPSTFVRQETWTNGRVQWFTGISSRSGRLLALGSKVSPRNGQAFVQYSGIWGSPGALYGTSGYWGPAFNETAMEDDHFITAWCHGIQASPEVMRAECYPRDISR